MQKDSRRFTPSAFNEDLSIQASRSSEQSAGAAQMSGMLKQKRKRKRREADIRLAATIKRQRRNRSLRSASAYAALVFFTIFTFIGFGAGDIENFSMNYITNKVNAFFNEEKDFGINGVSLGMTPERVREIYPDLSVTMAAGGAVKGRYSGEDANYNISFMDHNGVKKVSRIQYDKTFNSLSEDQILEKIGKKFGKPIASNCTRSSIRQVTNCNFLWWLSGGATLSVTSTQTRRPSGENRTKLSMVAADTYLEGKKLRAASKRRKTASTRPLKAIATTGAVPRPEKETLPF